MTTIYSVDIVFGKEKVSQNQQNIMDGSNIYDNEREGQRCQRK